jgi:hypothetical protein
MGQGGNVQAANAAIQAALAKAGLAGGAAGAFGALGTFGGDASVIDVQAHEVGRTAPTQK